MILYFSGTGNSKYIAKIIAEKTLDEPINMIDLIKEGRKTIEYGDHLCIVTPVYAWRAPAFIDKWVSETEFKGSGNIYYVFSCGGMAGNAHSYIGKTFASKGITLKGYAAIAMPDNYIIMFTPIEEEKQRELLEKAKIKAEELACLIAEGKEFPQIKPGLAGRFCSAVINPGFQNHQIADDKFYAENTCTSCGKCARICPFDNIEMADGKPRWKGNCTHCMACINHCPVAAIEYGKKTKGKKRYVCPF